MQESPELVFIGLAISLICLGGIVSALLVVPKAFNEEATKVDKGKKNEN